MQMSFAFSVHIPCSNEQESSLDFKKIIVIAWRTIGVYIYIYILAPQEGCNNHFFKEKTEVSLIWIIREQKRRLTNESFLDIK